MINFYLTHQQTCQYLNFVNVNPITLTDNLTEYRANEKISSVINGLTINALMPSLTLHHHLRDLMER